MAHMRAEINREGQQAVRGKEKGDQGRQKGGRERGVEGGKEADLLSAAWCKKRRSNRVLQTLLTSEISHKLMSTLVAKILLLTFPHY